MSDRGHAWEKVYNHVRGLIEQEKLVPGDRVPSELALVDELQVSRQTVRAALSRLQQDGLLTEGRGSAGRQVREYRPLYWNLHSFERGDRRDDPEKKIDEWKADIADQGFTPSHDISVSIMPAPTEVARCLNLQRGDMAVRRRRLRRADSVPIGLADTWVPESVGRMEVDGSAPLLSSEDVVLPGGIFSSLGLVQVELDDEITVRMPTPEEVDLLDLGSGSPVGQVDRVGYDQDDAPVRLIRTVFPGHRLKLRYRMEV